MATKKSSQIIALGGGGVGLDKFNLAIDNYKIKASGEKNPKIAFLPTAVGDSAFAIEKFYRVFPPERAIASHLPLFSRDSRDLEDYLLNQNIIEVSGGNTANMLAIWKIHGIDKILKKAWENGIILTGASAGMICWYECSVTDSFGPSSSLVSGIGLNNRTMLKELNSGLGFLKGSACPHYNGEEDRRPTYEKLIKNKILSDGIALDDYVGAHYKNNKLIRLITPKNGSKGYKVSLENNVVKETIIEPELIS